MTVMDRRKGAWRWQPVDGNWRAFGVRLTSRTSSSSAPPRSKITVAAWRGRTGWPGLYCSPGPGRSPSSRERIGGPYLSVIFAA